MVTLITDKIGIGDATDARQPGKAFDASLNVAIDLDIPLMGGDLHRHKIGLVDGPGNDDYALMAAVLMLHSLNRKYNRILVHCQAGASRSVMVVAAYVSILTGDEFHRVMENIMKNRGVSDYRSVLYQQFNRLIPIIKNLIKTQV